MSYDPAGKPMLDPDLVSPTRGDTYHYPLLQHFRPHQAGLSHVAKALLVPVIFQTDLKKGGRGLPKDTLMN